MSVTVPPYKKPKRKVNPYRATLFAGAALLFLAINAFVLAAIAGYVDMSSGWGFVAGFLMIPTLILDILALIGAGALLHEMAEDWDDQEASSNRRGIND